MIKNYVLRQRKKTSINFSSTAKIIACWVFLMISGASAPSQTVDSLKYWAKRDSHTTHPLNYAIYGKDRFLAVGDTDILDSPDGTNWTIRSTVSSPLRGAVFANGLYVVVGDGVILTSPDATNWTHAVSAPGRLFRRIVFAQGKFVTFGGIGTSASTYYSEVFTSTNGVTWASKTLGSASRHRMSDVTYGNDMFVSVGEDFFNEQEASSKDGNTWNLQDDSGGFAIAYGNGLFVKSAYATAPSGFFSTSPDGTNWVRTSVNWETYSESILYANGLFIATYGADLMISDDNSKTFIVRGTGFAANLHAVAFGLGKYVAVGDGGLIIQSLAFPEPITVPDFRFDPPFPFDGAVQLELRGNLDPIFSIQRSTNLVDWVDFQTASNRQADFHFERLVQTNGQREFFRAAHIKQPPFVEPVASLTGRQLDLGYDNSASHDILSMISDTSVKSSSGDGGTYIYSTFSNSATLSLSFTSGPLYGANALNLLFNAGTATDGSFTGMRPIYDSTGTHYVPISGRFKIN